MNKEAYLAALDPELAPMYQSLPEYTMDTYEVVSAIRANADKMFRSEEWSVENRPDIRLRVYTIPNGNHAGDLELRTYRPSALDGILPCILYFHGGGCVFGRAFHDDKVCAELALQENCVVVNVDYRCAPDHPAPAGQLDCLAAYRWLIGPGADLLDINPDKIIIHGNSGGGNMAVGLTLRIMDEKLKPPAAVIPLYPMIDHRGVNPSSYIVEDNTVWGREQNQKAWSYYLYGLDEDHQAVIDGYTVPALRESFAGFPKTFTFVGGMELFRDEVLEMVSKMSRDGVEVDFTLYANCFHAFEQYVPTADVSKRALEAKHWFIQKVFSLG